MPDEEDDDVPPVVGIPITDELDLHTFAPAEVASVVEEYLRECRTRGILTVRLVHGRGRGVQRAIVRQVLEGLPWVAGFEDAPASWGGWGATLARLQPPDRLTP